MKKFYSFSPVVLFGLIGLLNASNRLIVCSLVYVCIATLGNIMAQVYGKKKTIQMLVFSLVVHAMLSWNTQYAAKGVNIDLMTSGSFLSAFVSVNYGINAVARFRTIFNFHISNFLSLLVSSILDCSIMAIVLSSKFSTSKVLSIFVKDFMFKSSYTLVVGLLIIAIVYLYQWFCMHKTHVSKHV